MIQSYMSMRPVRGSIASRGWWMCCSVQAAAKRCCAVSISWLLTEQPHTHLNTPPVMHKTHIWMRETTALGNSKWTSQCAERNSGMLSCRRKAEEGRALSDRQHTLRRSGGKTKDEIWHRLSALLLSTPVHLLFSSDHRPKRRIIWIICKTPDFFQLKVSQSDFTKNEKKVGSASYRMLLSCL